jgi:ethanolamine utilization protein EutP (predicted NTPase)
MSQAITMSSIAIDVKAVLNALGDHEVRFNAKLMSRAAKVLRLILNADLEDTEYQVVKKEEE